jgi:hypothetical protein
VRPNPVFKVAVAEWSMNIQTGRTRAARRWVARCPSCGGLTCGQYTRKAAKDALHSHKMEQHHN